jgi:hypothetical protein
MRIERACTRTSAVPAIVLGLSVITAGCHAALPQRTPTLAVPYASGPVTSSVLHLPARGEVRLDRVADGSLVWVVRSEGDQVHVLAVDARALQRDRTDQVHAVMTRFDPDCACFRGAAPVVWSLEGSVFARSMVDYEALGIRGSAIGLRRSFDGDSVYALDRYEVVRDGETVRVGSRWLSTVLVDPDEHLASQVLDTEGPRTVRAIDPVKRARP